MDDRFLHDDFLLSGETARALFHGVAERLPIVDVHTHLPPADIAANRRFETLTDLWLEDDHYKWRAMRLAGADERLITGDADPWARFAAWAETVPGLVAQPAVRLDAPRAAPGVRDRRSARDRGRHARSGTRPTACSLTCPRGPCSPVSTSGRSRRRMTRATTSPHIAQLRETGGAPVMIPTFRPDAAHRLLDDPAAWNRWADRLGAAAAARIDDLDSLLAALTAAHGRFAELGSRASDHGLAALPDADRDPHLADAAVRRARSGEAPPASERDAVLLEVVALAARLAAADDGVLQLHLGARRDLSPRILGLVGHDAGADAVDDGRQGPGLARFLASLEREGTLPRTVIYNANPADDALFATVSGAFSRPGTAPLVQWGPPWWFNDHEDGMRRQLDELSRTGRLAGFMGMVADSRSLLSMTRQELFRRTLCDTLGRDAEAGLIPADLDLLSEIVRAVCVDNAVTWFGL